MIIPRQFNLKQFEKQYVVESERHFIYMYNGNFGASLLTFLIEVTSSTVHDYD